MRRTVGIAILFAHSTGANVGLMMAVPRDTRSASLQATTVSSPRLEFASRWPTTTPSFQAMALPSLLLPSCLPEDTSATVLTQCVDDTRQCEQLWLPSFYKPGLSFTSLADNPSSTGFGPCDRIMHTHLKLAHGLLLTTKSRISPTVSVPKLKSKRRQGMRVRMEA
jgi:hypothetical protein